MSNGSVYFVRSGRYVKIGWTTGSVSRRIESLQVGNPIPIELIGSALGEPFREAQLHQIASPAHVRGEWFHGDHDVIRRVIEAMTEGSLWQLVDSLGPVAAPKPRAIVEACPHPAAQWLLSYMRSKYISVPAFCEAHGLDRRLVARVLNGKITRYSIDFALSIERATGGALGAKSWCSDDATRSAIEVFRRRKAVKAA